MSNWIELKQDVLRGTFLKTLLVNFYMIDLPEQVSESGRLQLRKTVFCSVVTIPPIFKIVAAKYQNLGNYFSINRLNLKAKN